MTNYNPDVELMIGVDGTFRRVPVASIAAVLHLPSATLRESFSRLLFALLDRSDESGPMPEGEIPEGESVTVRSDNVSEPIVRNTEHRNVLGPETFLSPPPPSERSDVGAREATDHRPQLVTGALLASALDDEASLPFYDQLVRTTPSTILAQALDETLRRRSLIRGRPGAYFTALVRRLLPHPYAAPSSPST